MSLPGSHRSNLGPASGFNHGVKPDTPVRRLGEGNAGRRPGASRPRKVELASTQ
jgi:hypothetical protein